MGVLEEGGKVASGFISALGSQPVLLVQSAILAGVVFILYAQGTRAFIEREQLLKSVFDAQSHVREILSQCIVLPDERDKKRSDLKHLLPDGHDVVRVQTPSLSSAPEGKQ
jgi:hypothetical protein